MEPAYGPTDADEAIERELIDDVSSRDHDDSEAADAPGLRPSDDEACELNLRAS